MEPALDERGDTSGGSSPARRAMPQWSPLSTSGATNRQIHLVGDLVGPQWSPLSTSGATGPRRTAG